MNVKSFATLLVVVGSLTARANTVHAQESVATAERSNAERHATDELFARLVTVNMTRVSLRRAIDAVAESAKVPVQYQSRLLEAYDSPVTINLRKAPLHVALDRLLAGTDLRAVSDGQMQVVIVPARDAKVSPSVAGSITGTVVDSKTQSPLRGAMVSLDGSTRGVPTGADGSFRLTNVSAGEHHVTVRLLGYVKQVKSVQILEAQSSTIHIAMEASAKALDQVVVTGTVVATEIKAIPNAITVITAKQIEQRGITRIDQLFRGDVPGLFAQASTSGDYLGSVAMFSRGASTLSADWDYAANGLLTNPIKTYVDGIELADPHFLSKIDPRSIERIEILTGPQASTIYGSNALNGVMQIFTKRGVSNRPDVTATLLSGTLQNNFSSALAPQHDYSAQARGIEGRLSYSAGGSWTRIGRWTPGVRQTVASGTAGARLQGSRVTADGTYRLSNTKNNSQGWATQVSGALVERGFYNPDDRNNVETSIINTLRGQTVGLNLGYTPASWWSHELVFGRDASNWEDRQTERDYKWLGDTLLQVVRNGNVRTSVRYSTTTRISLGDPVKLTVAAGADGWRNELTSMYALVPSLTAAHDESVKRLPIARNKGGFIQGQLSVSDALFLTYGLRAEWNPNYGEDAQPNLAPRYGVAYSRDLETPWGPLITKLRGSYGRSTRPPNPEYKTSIKAVDRLLGFFMARVTPWWGKDVLYRVPNPELGPEAQQGGEGGLELYFGNRASFVVTRFNQTVTNLLVEVPAADSVRSFVPIPLNSPVYGAISFDQDRYGYFGVRQYLNVADIRNQGWELQGTLSTGPFTTRGTYSWSKSRVIGVTPQYRARVSGANEAYAPGSMIQGFPEHTWSVATTYAQRATSVTLNVNGIGQNTGVNNFYNQRADTRIRLQYDQQNFRGEPYPNIQTKGYATADLNASQRVNQHIDGVLQVQNLTNRYRSDSRYVDNAVLGRQTKAGFRIKF